VKEKKKEKQININYTQEGIDIGHSLRGSSRANNRRGGGKAGEQRARNMNLMSTITRN
jgi:hypothetical protein